MRTASTARLVSAVLCLWLIGCGADTGATGADDGRLSVVAGFYPLAEAARRVGGDAVEVQDLTPAGAEPHDLEVTPGDIDRLASADVVLVMGRGFQPAVEDALRDRDGQTVELLDALRVPQDETDVHVWLDPGLMREIVDITASALAESDPGRADAYGANAERMGDELVALDRSYAARLGECRSRTLVTAHAAFAWMARAYDLEQEAIAGVSPEQEPSPGRLDELVELVEAEGVGTVFTETLVSPEVAETLAREVGVDTAVLNPLEGLTDDQRESGEDYVSVMEANLEVLATGLGCA